MLSTLHVSSLCKNKMVKGKPVCEHAPKRPLSGYFLFAGDVRSKIAQANEDWGVGEVAGEIGRQWGDLPESKKKPYLEKAEKASIAYKKKLEKYKQSSHYTKHQAKLAEWKKEQGNKKFKKDPNKPKRALSAYMIFVNEKRPSLTKEGYEMLEIAKKAAEMWKKLSDAQKVPYEKKAAKAKKEADAAMAKYMKSKQYKDYMAAKAEHDAKRMAAKKATPAKEVSKK